MKSNINISLHATLIPTKQFNIRIQKGAAIEADEYYVLEIDDIDVYMSFNQVQKLNDILCSFLYADVDRNERVSPRKFKGICDNKNESNV